MKTDWTEGLEKYPIHCKIDKRSIDKQDYFRYVKHNIPGPAVDPGNFEAVYEGCLCTVCTKECPCIMRFGEHYGNKTLLHQDCLKEENLKPIVECNLNCLCSKSCENRLVQHGVQVKLELFATENKGIGVKTLQALESGQFVCEYAGEILSFEEARNRSLNQKPDDMNYILTLQEHCAGQVIRTHVDPQNFGNVGRFINHSCDPNLSVIPVRVSSQIPLLCLFTNRKIEIGEELTFHYGISDNGNSHMENLSDTKDHSKPCFCLSKNCSGYLPYDRSLFKE